MTAPNGHWPCKAKIYAGTFGVSCIFSLTHPAKPEARAIARNHTSGIQESDSVPKSLVYILQNILQYFGILFMFFHPWEQESWF